jgi:hypothetical protein
MITAVVLVALTVACRLLFPVLHWWNCVPIGAVALYAGARLPRRWAWAVPIAGIAISNVFLDLGQNRPVFDLTRLIVYATLVATAWLGLIARSPKVRPWMLPGLSLLGSTLFFVTTNFAVWAEGQWYPLTWSGLVDCYIKGIPFHRHTVVAELLGTCVLFGLGPVIEQAAARAARAWSGHGVEKPEAAEMSEIA